MTAPHRCPQCDQAISSDAPQGLCPECLLKAVLSREGASELTRTEAFASDPVAKSGLVVGMPVKYFGDYELLQEIARGGMGVVWKARQSSLNRDVALKMIRAGALASPEEVARFHREAQAAANLQHPNIVAIHEVGEHHGQHYFSMDLIDGRDLGKLVADEGPLVPRRAARYVKILAEAIQFAHQRGTLHRDLKPQNVLIDSADQPRITDFGLAKIMEHDSRLTQSGVVMGSPSYMPPEQAAGHLAQIGPASDIYSLGAILHELLTGQPPFQGPTAMATLREVMDAEPVALRQLKADIPPDLETICLKCLEKLPSARYATAQALAEELDRFLEGDPIQARPAGTVRKAVSWTRRNPRVLAALATLIMVTLAFSVLYLSEENAFLRAQKADPSLVRRPGRLHDSLIYWFASTGLICASFWFAFTIVRARGRGLSFKQWATETWHPDPSQPLDQTTRTCAAVLGLILINGGGVLLVKMVQTYVREGFGEADVYNMFWIFILVYWGLEKLRMVIRDHRLVHHGLPAGPENDSIRKLTDAQVDRIRLAILEDRGIKGKAIRLYREAFPGANYWQATDELLRLAAPLILEHPEKFVVPTMSLAALNWKALGFFLLIEGAFLAVLYLALLKVSFAWPVMWFVQSLILGAIFLGGTQVATWWKKLLLGTLGTLMMVLNLFIPMLMLNRPEHNGWALWTTAFLGGSLCGLALRFMTVISRPKAGTEDGTPKPDRA